jgi:hypothetical protein
MSEQLYRRRGSDEFIVSGDNLVNGFVADVDCGDKPPDPRFTKTLWYCPNSDCTAREVTLEDNYLGGRPPSSPPPAWCPRCGQPLSFEYYLGEEVLIPSTTPKKPSIR